jgi:hypothetical protein
LLSQRRVLTLETVSLDPPLLEGAELVRTDAGRHEFAFDAARVKLSDLLEQAAAQTEVLDVETHRTPIDQVVADLYEQWLQASPSSARQAHEPV